MTDGAGPVSIVYRGKKYRAVPPRINPINPIGSGDCLLAGLVDGWLAGLEPEPLFRHAVACAVANASGVGRRRHRGSRGRPLAGSGDG